MSRVCTSPSRRIGSKISFSCLPLSNGKPLVRTSSQENLASGRLGVSQQHQQRIGIERLGDFRYDLVFPNWNREESEIISCCLAFSRFQLEKHISIVSLFFMMKSELTEILGRNQRIPASNHIFLMPQSDSTKRSFLGPRSMASVPANGGLKVPDDLHTNGHLLVILDDFGWFSSTLQFHYIYIHIIYTDIYIHIIYIDIYIYI